MLRSAKQKNVRGGMGRATHQITPIKPQQPIHDAQHLTNHRTAIEPAFRGDDGEEVLEDAVECEELLDLGGGVDEGLEEGEGFCGDVYNVSLIRGGGGGGGSQIWGCRKEVGRKGHVTSSPFTVPWPLSFSRHVEKRRKN